MHHVQEWAQVMSLGCGTGVGAVALVFLTWRWLARKGLVAWALRSPVQALLAILAALIVLALWQ